MSSVSQPLPSGGTHVQDGHSSLKRKREGTVPQKSKRTKKETATKAPEKQQDVSYEGDESDNMPEHLRRPALRKSISRVWTDKKWHSRTNPDGTTTKVEGRLWTQMGNIAHPYDKTTVTIETDLTMEHSY